jgi:hypothetical protein
VRVIVASLYHTLVGEEISAFRRYRCECIHSSITTEFYPIPSPSPTIRPCLDGRFSPFDVAGAGRIPLDQRSSDDLDRTLPRRHRATR